MFHRKAQGFSTIEVLIAGVVLAVGALAVGGYLQATWRLSDQASIQSQFDLKCRVAQVYVTKQALQACATAKKISSLAWATNELNSLLIDKFFEKSMLHRNSDGAVPISLREKTVYLQFDSAQSSYELQYSSALSASQPGVLVGRFYYRSQSMPEKRWACELRIPMTIENNRVTACGEDLTQESRGAIKEICAGMGGTLGNDDKCILPTTSAADNCKDVFGEYAELKGEDCVYVDPNAK